MRNNLRLLSHYTFVFSSAFGLVTATHSSLAFGQDTPLEGELTPAQAEPTPPEAQAAPEASPTPAPSEEPAPPEEVAPPEEQVPPEETPEEQDRLAREETRAGASTAALEAKTEGVTYAVSNDGGVATGEVVDKDSWFYRPSLSVSAGEGKKKVELTFYGFLQFDVIHDTTRSYPEDIGARVVARTDTFDGTTGRTQFTAKNTRIGFRLNGPQLGGVTPTMVIEGDFFGNQPGFPPDEPEGAFYESPTFRLRHGFVRLANKVVDVTVGQTFDIFGWQNYFYPATAEFLGHPSMAFSRPLQVQLFKGFGKESALGLDVAAAAVRPAQRDSQVPDLRAGLRLKVNGFKGLRTPGNGDPDALPMAIGVSGTVRQFKVDAFTPPPTQSANSVTGWGLSVDALIPVIPTKSKYDRSNAFTLTGAFVMGTGIGDLMAATGGARFPNLPNAAQANPPPEYHANVDPGMVTFDSQGVLNTIDWQGFRAGAQYYLPPSGRVILAVNYSQAQSANMEDLYPQGGAEIELLGRVANAQRYIDGTLFWDATSALRFGLSGSYTTVRYLDGDEPHNIRGRGQVMYSF